MSRVEYWLKKLLRKILSYFFQGLIIIAPISITAYVSYNFLMYLYNWLSVNLPDYKNFNMFLLLFTDLVVITVIGFLASSFLTKKLFKIPDWLLRKIPVINVIYTSLQDFFKAFIGTKRKFKHPVLVKINDTGLKRIGFVTEKDLTPIGIDTHSAVFVPTSYNLSGQLYIVPNENIEHIEASGLDVYKFIASGGVADLEGGGRLPKG